MDLFFNQMKFGESETEYQFPDTDTVTVYGSNTSHIEMIMIKQ